MQRIYRIGKDDDFDIESISLWMIPIAEMICYFSQTIYLLIHHSRLQNSSDHDLNWVLKFETRRSLHGEAW